MKDPNYTIVSVKMKAPPGCTTAEAEEHTREAMKIWAGDAPENGDPIPEPKKGGHMKDLEYYMELDWTYELRAPAPREEWFIKVAELPGCMSQGKTLREAFSNIKEAMELWIEVALEDGDPIPEPEED